jgi:hypothetical protein
VGIDDGVGDGEETQVLFIGSLRRFERGISPGGGARRWRRCLGAAGFPVASDGTARAGRRDGSGRGVGRSWWQRSSTRGGGLGAGHPAACGGAGGADGDGAGGRSKWRPAACGLVVWVSD